MPGLNEYAENWLVSVDRVEPTPTSLIAYGMRARQPVVLKVSNERSDEHDGGAVAQAFAGRGMVRVLEHTRGAVLLERLLPGTLLTELAQRDDDSATTILAEVVAALHATPAQLIGATTLHDWGRGFEKYSASNDEQIPRELVNDAANRFKRLVFTQQDVRLLHGDLQHYNILFDEQRGWTAIDPKGLVGELEFELGAALRNPHERPELYSSTDAVLRRVQRFTDVLRVNTTRVLEWAYAQSVLSAIWTVEDEGVVSPDDPAMRLVTALAPVVAELAHEG